MMQRIAAPIGLGPLLIMNANLQDPFAQTGGNDEKHEKEFCQVLQRNPDGSWTASAPVRVDLPKGGKVSLGRMTVRKGAIMTNGIDLATFFDEQCGLGPSTR